MKSAYDWSNPLENLPTGTVNVNGMNVPEWSDLAKTFLAQQAQAAKPKAQTQVQAPQYLRDLVAGAPAQPTGQVTGKYSLSDLMNNPAGTLANNPFFAASADAGQEAAKRRLAQMGMGTSGNAALELQRAAQSNMSGDFFRMADLLGTQQQRDEQARQFNIGTLENARQFDVGGAERARQFDYTNTGQVLMPGQPKKSPQQMGLGSYWGGY